jgi:hypothetical protein
MSFVFLTIEVVLLGLVTPGTAGGGIDTPGSPTDGGSLAGGVVGVEGGAWVFGSMGSIAKTLFQERICKKKK